ncbi:diguanylate cyclase (GGDEF) domain-containing protein [Oceanospirillum multiglobuliferum]|uniref:diguanylate cyclase n=1 Tax=Oceanospirillum multiglobuliferum TaxID=64969 RepID=A0A1T4M069_9GAMM|nr:sensor domain-containing diguanylate cyclase [Oceanospirillum multiglobuliferum]OPX56295.1 hypothetical protein BTE48_04795 [Oceanospirillum multiglobuliferum]SJZ60287.1 diguanylate cyclase (GGDEF) domain-containing protein [Oceanospirillum multiglobuliferum]
MLLFEQALNKLQSGVMILDSELNVIFVNHWLVESFTQVSVVQGSVLTELLPELSSQRIYTCIRQALDRGLPAVLSPALNRTPLPLYSKGKTDAEPFAQMIRIQPIKHDNKSYCMLEVQDVSTMMHRERLLNQQAKKLNQMALTDELTGVANRRCFNSLLEHAIAEATRQSSALSLLFFDIDCFKLYNDHLGHQAGDYCLSKITRVLSEHIKLTQGIDRAASLARYGGEEFCIILPNIAPDDAVAFAESFRHVIETIGLPHPASPVSSVVTASFGISGFKAGKSDTFTSIVLKADNALYRAKASGRNQVVLANKE